MNENNVSEILSLFRKIICSLSCIERMATCKQLKSEAVLYLDDYINNYYKFLESSRLDKLSFKYNFEDIDDFSYRCIEYKNDDLIKLAEDLQYGAMYLKNTLDGK